MDISVNLYTLLIWLLWIAGGLVIAADLLGHLADAWHAAGMVLMMFGCTLCIRRALRDLNHRELRAFELGQEFGERRPLRRVGDGS